MSKQDEGWYWTWFYDGSKQIDEHPESDEKINGYVFSPFFVHRKHDDLERIIEILVDNEDKKIEAKREAESKIMLREIEYDGKLSKEEANVCNQVARGTIADLEAEIGKCKKWKKHWDFLHPSKKHWIYTGKTGRYNLIVRRYRNPLVLNVSGTMSYIYHNITIKILPDLHFKVNANGYDSFIRQITTIQKEEVSYAEIRTGPDGSTNFFPPEVVNELIKHPWEQYKEQMKMWLEERSLRLLTLPNSIIIST